MTLIACSSDSELWGLVLMFVVMMVAFVVIVWMGVR